MYRNIKCICLGALTLFILSMLVVGGFSKTSQITMIGKSLFANEYSLYYFGQDSFVCYMARQQHYMKRISPNRINQNKWQVALINQENESAREVINYETVENEELPQQIGEIYQESPTSPQKKSNQIVNTLKKTNSYEYLLKNFYIVDSTTSVSKTMFPVKRLLSKNLTLPRENRYQILIYHTHAASERYQDSRGDKEEDSVVGTGVLLAKELERETGYKVYHDKTKYDLIHGKIDRSLAYNYALTGIKKVLQENRGIRVIIDVHRDGVAGEKKDVTVINGKATAKAMFFNGLSRGRTGNISYLKNKNREGNLAFSLQLKCQAMQLYEGLTKPIYLKGYRYNLQLRERSLLIELGNQNNTVEEIHNAVAPLAKVIGSVLNPS